MGTLTQCEYQVANEVAKGQTPDEIADLLKKSIWTIKAQIRDIHKKLGINNNVELTLDLLCDRAKRNFNLKEIRKHGLFLIYSLWFLIIALFPDIQTDMRRLRMRSGIRISIRTINPERGRSLVFAA